MRISLDWLNEWVALPWDAETTAEKLADLGFPVESVTKTGVQTRNIVSAKLLTVEKHPNADRLSLTRVFDGKKERQVVCGAPNIAPGQVVPLALPGTVLPGGMEIKISKIRGIESEGMLCSERELGLSEEHAGIMQLAPDTELGKDLQQLFPGDTVFDLDIPPNRPDALSHVGIAREIAALAGIDLDSKRSTLAQKAEGGACRITVEAPDLCYRYLGRLVHAVQIRPSPDWMVRRLNACGIRAINNIVDITNYILLEWGHPLHAFDLRKLENEEIVVRRARPGERIQALDERWYDLTAQDLVIADGRHPVAIAGIMGGQQSGIDDKTNSLLLESAVFNPLTVRLTSRRLNLKSESSVRFEKGTDAETAAKAAARATEMIMELAGGKLGQAADMFPKKPESRKIQLRQSRLTRVVGSPLKPESTEASLSRLGFSPSKTEDGWHCEVPAHRKDIVEEMDLIEEALRIAGYNSVPDSIPALSNTTIPGDLAYRDTSGIAEVLKGFGLNETITSSFSAADWTVSFGVSKDILIPLANPISQEEDVLRPFLAPQLLKAAKRNFNFQADGVRLFEIGHRFEKTGTNECKETLALSLLLAGKMQKKDWDTAEKEAHIFQLKGIIGGLAKYVHLPIELVPSDHVLSSLHPRQSFSITFNNEPVGWAGALHPKLAVLLDISAPCVFAEFEMDKLLPSAYRPRFSALPRFSFVERDIAITVAASTNWRDIEGEVRSSAGPLLKDIYPFDIYSGKGIESGKKSIAFRIRLRDEEKTLSEAEIAGAVDRIKSSLQKRCGAQLR